MKILKRILLKLLKLNNKENKNTFTVIDLSTNEDISEPELKIIDISTKKEISKKVDIEIYIDKNKE